MRKLNPIDYGLFVLTVALYAIMGFVAERHQTFLLIGNYFAVFTLYVYITSKSDEEAIPLWFYASIAIRGMLLFSIPNLSDDFYRFIWDGRLLASGYHPFAEVPVYYIEQGLSIPGINEELFQNLNSPDYFTVYPPLAQFIFWLSVKLSPHSIYGSVFVLKLVVFLSEVGTLVVIKKLLAQFELPASRILLYALNPLIILELSGNVHLEAVLIFFLLLSLLLLVRERLILSGIALAMAICVKLIPLIFLPALLPRLGWKKAFVFYATIGVVAVILFLPLLDRSILTGFQNSLGYYFRKFEFNASIYYLVREWGLWTYGYNIIQTAGWQLGLLSTMIILFISFKSTRGIQKGLVDRRLPKIFMFALLSYFLFTTTLHPWYITTLFALSIFTEFRFVLLWTAMIFLTYAGYSVNGFQENLWLVGIEYISVLGYLAFELWRRTESFSPA